MENRQHGESRTATAGRCAGTDVANLEAAPVLAVPAAVLLATRASASTAAATPHPSFRRLRGTDS